MKKKTLLITVAVLIIGLITSAGSFALWTWISNTANQNLVFNTAKNLREYIIYEEGESSFAGDFNVSSTYTGGIHSTIAINKTEEAENAPLIATIHMDINQIGVYSKNSNALKWAVTEGDATNPGALLATDTFRGLNSGDSIVLVPNIEVTVKQNNEPTKYTIWIWLDANESPNPNLTGETLDTNVWTEINQLEGATNIFEISRISSDSQNITATVISSKSNVVSYAITTTNTEPASWTNIASNLQGNIYNFSENAPDLGTYYVWFKNAKGEKVSKQVTVTALDESRPSCSFGEFSESRIDVSGTANISLTCTDEQTRITTNTLTANDFTLSNANALTIDSVTRESIANGYKYTLTVTGILDDQRVAITLPADKIANSVGLKNLATTSEEIMVSNDKLAPTLTPTVEDGTTYTKTKQATITLADNLLLNPGTYTVKYGWSTSELTCQDLTQTTTITVASGESSNSANVTISTGDGAGKIYVCNTTDISDPAGNTLLANTVTSADMYLDNTGPTATLAVTTNGSILATLTDIADAGAGTNTPYYYKISNNSTCDSSTTGFNSHQNPSYAFTSGVTDAGIYYVCVKLNDTLGNSSYISDSIEIKAYLKTFTVDTSDFKEDDYRDKITKVEFVNSIDLTNAIPDKDPYILDEYNTGIIKGWLKQNDATNNTYDLYVGSNTMIYGKNLANVFLNMRNVENINLNNYLNASEATDAYRMFGYAGYNATNFSLDLGDNFNTSNVTNMYAMFAYMGYNANNFSLNLGNNFDTSNVTNMVVMFQEMGYNADDLVLNLGDKFDAGNVTNMQSMFDNMGRDSTNLNLYLGNNFNAGKTTMMNSMFNAMGYNSKNFSLDLGNNFNAGNVTGARMSRIFQVYGGKTNFYLNLGNNFNACKVTTMFEMFARAYSTTGNFSIDLGNNFNSVNVTNMGRLFMAAGQNATNFHLNLGNNFDTSNATSMIQMFNNMGSSSATFTLNLGDKFDTSKVNSSMYQMFRRVGYSATDFSLNLGDKFNTSNVTEMHGMFTDMGYSVTDFSLNLGDHFNTSKVTLMNSMFANMGYSATDFNLNLGNKFNTTKVTSMANMFQSMGRSATSFNFDLGNDFDTTKVQFMGNMFRWLGQRTSDFTLNLGDKFDTSNVTDMQYMFSSAGQSATNFNLDLGNHFNTINVQLMNGMFSHMAYSAPDFDLTLDDNFDTSNVTTMQAMFHNMGRLSNNFSLNLGNSFNSSNVKTMYYMFTRMGYSANNFSLNLGNNFDTSNVTNMATMFQEMGYNANNLDLNLGDKFDTGNVTTFANMFYQAGYNADILNVYLGNNFNASKVTDLGTIFSQIGYSANNFTLDLGNNFNASSVTSTHRWLEGIGKETGSFTLNLGNNFNLSTATKSSQMFWQAGYNATSFSLDLGNNFNSIQVTNMYYMFGQAGKSAQHFNLNLGNSFYTSVVTNMVFMFNQAGSSAQTPFILDLSASDFTNVTAYSGMFTGFPTSKATIYVKDATAQNWIISKGGSGFSATNVLIKGTS